MYILIFLVVYENIPTITSIPPIPKYYAENNIPDKSIVDSDSIRNLEEFNKNLRDVIKSKERQYDGILKGQLPFYIFLRYITNNYQFNIEKLRILIDNMRKFAFSDENQTEESKENLKIIYYLNLMLQSLNENEDSTYIGDLINKILECCYYDHLDNNKQIEILKKNIKIAEDKAKLLEEQAKNVRNMLKQKGYIL